MSDTDNTANAMANEGGVYDALVVRKAQGAFAHFERRGHAHELAPITDWIAALQQQNESLAARLQAAEARCAELERDAEKWRDDCRSTEVILAAARRDIARHRKYYEVTQHGIGMAKMALMRDDSIAAGLHLRDLSDAIDAALTTIQRVGGKQESSDA